MIKGKTKSGFKYELDERIKSDWRVLEAITDTESEDASVMMRGIKDLANLLLGDNKQKLFEHISKKNDGFVPSESVIAELTEILSTESSLKN